MTLAATIQIPFCDRTVKIRALPVEPCLALGMATGIMTIMTIPWPSAVFTIRFMTTVAGFPILLERGVAATGLNLFQSDTPTEVLFSVSPGRKNARPTMDPVASGRDPPAGRGKMTAGASRHTI